MCRRRNGYLQPPPASRSDTAGRAGRPDDMASKLAASEVSNAVLPARAKPVTPIRMVLRSCSTSEARRLALLRPRLHSVKPEFGKLGDWLPMIIFIAMSSNFEMYRFLGREANRSQSAII